MNHNLVTEFMAAFHSNLVWNWALAFLVAVLVFAVLHLAKAVIYRRLSAVAAGTKTQLDDIAVAVLGKTHILFLAMLALYAGSGVLALPPVWENVLAKASVFAFFVQGAVWGSSVINFVVGRLVDKHGDAGLDATVPAGVLAFLARVVIWAAVVLVVLDNLGVKVTALVAGLGVGSVAVALALQNILKDLFAAVSIILDKPFAIGDFIVVDTFLGTVERIGVKSTRLRSLNGELLVFSNNDLLNSRIRNYQRMYERRVLFTLGVTYGTPHEKLAAIPGMVRGIIEEQQKTRFDRAHFKEYGNFSLNFEIVYYVLDPDYSLFMDIQETINLAIYDRFAREGIEFAFPTQTIFLEKGN